MKNLLFTLLFLIGFAIHAQSQESSNISKKYNLNYQMKKGTEFTFYSLGYGSVNNVIGDTTEFFSSRKRDLIQEYKVLSSNVTGMAFEVKYRKLEFIDTDKHGNLTVTPFSSLKGKTVHFTMKPNGELTDFKGFDDIQEMPFPSGVMDGDLCKTELTHMFPVFPDEPLSIGETWTRNGFGYIMKYRVIGEMKYNGYDCIRIFARFIPENPKYTRKDETGRDVSVEIKGGFYSDIYYYAYKEKMILYRFSVDSYREVMKETPDHNVTEHYVRDQAYEEHIIFKK